MLTLFLSLQACAHVPAWKKEKLAHRAMADTMDPEAKAVAAHIAGAREAALDPDASGGGGCGCN